MQRGGLPLINRLRSLLRGTHGLGFGVELFANHAPPSFGYHAVPDLLTSVNILRFAWIEVKGSASANCDMHEIGVYPGKGASNYLKTWRSGRCSHEPLCR